MTDLPSFAIIIPARYASTRYPGKPLVPLRGATGEAKTLIRRSWECASAVKAASAVWIATDDDRIRAEVESFGGNVVMTDPSCRNGTERCADAIDKLGDIAEVIVNLQGDAPLSPPFLVSTLVARLADEPALAVATPAVQCSQSVYQHLTTDAENGRVGGTTVVCSGSDRALYFSKRVLPFLPQPTVGNGYPPVHLHLGMYAYRPASLRAYRDAPMCQLEELEGLEQLRFLDIGESVGVVRVSPLSWDAIELNNPTDVPEIERILSERAII